MGQNFTNLNLWPQKNTCFEQGFARKPAWILMDLPVPSDGSQTRNRRGLPIAGLGIPGPIF